MCSATNSEALESTMMSVYVKPHNKYFPFLPTLFMAPSVLIGMFVMYQSQVPASIWLQNLVTWIILSLVSFAILSRRAFPKVNRKAIIFLSIALLGFTFLDAGTSSVHRYISVGFIHLNVGSIVLPVLLIELASIATDKNYWKVTVLTLGISLMLLLQPDASQVTAFSIASIFYLRGHETKRLQYVVSIVFALFSILAWIYLDDLPPVDYVEGILVMARKLGSSIFVLSIVSLVLLLLPFFLFKSGTHSVISVSLGIYFSLVLLSTIFGHFPVPLMGYGISPIIGYFIAITWHFRRQKLRKDQTANESIRKKPNE